MRAVCALVAVLALAAGCSGSDGADTAASPETDASTAPETITPPPAAETTSAASTEAAPPAPPRETRPYQVWFSQGDVNLELLWERGPVTLAAAQTALRLLLTTRKYVFQPYHLDSSIPRGTRLLGVDLSDGIATVDLSREFSRGPQDKSSLAFRAAQVVYTATQFPTVKAVLLRVEGRPHPAPSGEGLGVQNGASTEGAGTPLLRRPLTRRDYEALLPPIVIEAPAEGARVGRTITVSGTANVFEANVTLRVEDARGRQLVRTFTTATCGSGCRGTFRKTLRLPPRARGRLRIWAEDDDADGDGHPSYGVAVPVVAKR